MAQQRTTTRRDVPGRPALASGNEVRANAPRAGRAAAGKSKVGVDQATDALRFALGGTSGEGEPMGAPEGQRQGCNPADQEEKADGAMCVDGACI